MGKGYLSHNNAHVVYSGTRATVRHARHGDPDPSAVAIVNRRMPRGLGNVLTNANNIKRKGARTNVKKPERERTDAHKSEKKNARMHVGWVSVLSVAYG